MRNLLRRKQEPLLPPVTKTFYPSGSCIHTEKGYYFIKSTNSRVRITHRRILDSWKFDIFESTEAAAAGYKVAAGKVGFRSGTLIRDISDNRIYLISGTQKRHIVNPDILSSLCRRENEVLTVSHEEAEMNSDGEVLN